ncbi:MAG: S9 family peptidase [Sphingomonas sp.]|nr:S9 family peptidase [Sphingomonas sp.]
MAAGSDLQRNEQVKNPARRLALVASLFALALVPATSIAQPQAPSAVQIRQVGTATLQNVPPIPDDIKASVQRYQNYREAAFQDWLPDGSMLITTRFAATNQVHRVTAPGGARSQLTFFDEPVADAKAIPGTQRFILTRDTGGDEWFQLFATGLQSQPVQLTEPGTRNQNLVVSKDGRLAAWARATKGSSDYSIMVADPASPGSRRVAYQGQGAIAPTDISADKSHILLTRVLNNREQRLLLLDVASGRATELAWTRDPARYQQARFSPSGTSVLVVTDHGSDLLRLVEIDIASGRRTMVTPQARWEVEGFDVSNDGRLIAYSLNEDGFSRVRLIDRSTGREVARPELPGGVLTGFDFSPDGRSLAVSLSTPTSAGDVWALDLASGRLDRWTNSELGPVEPRSLSEPQLIRFQSFDGLSVPAFVYRPTGVAPGARTPVVIDIHGGPEAQTRPRWNPISQQIANELGATVILPNVRGSDGYGKRYLNLDNGPKREDSVKDIGALLDWVARQPNLDSSKVAVYGQSYGGYMSLASMIHYSDRLVGGVERYGISDFITFLTNTESYRRDNRRGEYGDERLPEMRAVFQRINPLANVSKIGKPMLVMQGANDPRVPKSESDQVVERIRSNGAEVWYVVFSDEGHGFQKKPNNDLRREVETLFLRRLFN